MYDKNFLETLCAVVNVKAFAMRQLITYIHALLIWSNIVHYKKGIIEM